MRSTRRMMMPPTIQQAAMKGMAVSGLSSTRSSSFFRARPATTAGTSARISPSAKRRASAELGRPISAFQKVWK